MKTDFGLQIPGVKGLFDSCEDIRRRTELPRNDKDHLRIPDVVELKQRRTGQCLGRVPWSEAAIIFG